MEIGSGHLRHRVAGRTCSVGASLVRLIGAYARMYEACVTRSHAHARVCSKMIIEARSREPSPEEPRDLEHSESNQKEEAREDEKTAEGGAHCACESWQVRRRVRRERTTRQRLRLSDAMRGEGLP